MADLPLKDRRILVVEDEYLLAEDLAMFLAGAGAEVVGPVPRVDDALALIAADSHIDAAILDVNLRGEMVFSVASLLQDQSIPFAFTTGYDAGALPKRFASCPRLEKPIKKDVVVSIFAPLASRSAG